MLDRNRVTGAMPRNRIWTYAIGALLMVAGAAQAAMFEQPDEGVSLSLTLGTWTESQALHPHDVHEPPFDLNFGSHVDIDGDTLIASTQYDKFQDDWLKCPQIGHDDGCDWVYVFERDEEGHWMAVDKLVPENAKEKDSFGFAVAVDEQSGVIVVGNPGVKYDTNELYIFERGPNGAWGQTAMFHVVPDIWSIFASSVDVSGHTVIASGGDKTYVFDKVENEWRLATMLDGAGSPSAIAIKGDMIVNINYYLDELCNGGALAGHYVQVYRRVDGDWALASTMEPEPAEGSSQTLPTRVGLSDDGMSIIIGAAVDRRVYGVPTEHCFYWDGGRSMEEVFIHTLHGLLGPVGSAWIYEYRGGDWELTADIPNPLPNPAGGGGLFGQSVDIDGSVAVIGDSLDMYGLNPGRPGSAYIYEKVGGEWILQARLQNDNHDGPDWFGHSVAISGETVVVGADLNTRTGTAHVFEPLISPSNGGRKG